MQAMGDMKGCWKVDEHHYHDGRDDPDDHEGHEGHKKQVVEYLDHMVGFEKQEKMVDRPNDLRQPGPEEDGPLGPAGRPCHGRAVPENRYPSRVPQLLL